MRVVRGGELKCSVLDEYSGHMLIITEARKECSYFALCVYKWRTKQRREWALFFLSFFI